MDDPILLGYLHAKRLVIDAGYESDITWAENLAHVRPDNHYVMREYAWVVVNSGFRYKVAQKLWPGLRMAFHEFVPQLIDQSCRRPGLAVLNHTGKIDAILKTAATITAEGVGSIIADAADPLRLTRLPWIGKITCWHLAKVLGADVVKPDVHLKRAATATGHGTPMDLCVLLRDRMGDRVTVVDSVSWGRY